MNSTDCSRCFITPLWQKRGIPQGGGAVNEGLQNLVWEVLTQYASEDRARLENERDVGNFESYRL